MGTGIELAIFDGEKSWAHRLPQKGTLGIGRDPGNEIRIPSSSVSRKHAALHFDGGLRVEDLGGANGTLVRQRQVGAAPGQTEGLLRLTRTSAPLSVGDALMLGTVMLVVRFAPSAVPNGAGLAEPHDPGMVALHAQARRVADSPFSVLVLGETGAGKEVLARQIHGWSPRRAGAFLGLNCAALPESLLESELFGHEKGAFTGADSPRPGLFEAASGGTVFLDEVGELPASVQVKLLRVLEERVVLRVGARSPRPVDIRFIAATNRDMDVEVAAGRFRSDLFFRLNTVSLTIPPLRARPSEICLLAEQFVADAATLLARARPPVLAPETLAALMAYPWPGNVRELKHAMERAVVLAGPDSIDLEHLSPGLTRSAPAGSSRTPPHGERAAPDRSSAQKLEQELRDLERARIVDALERCGGNQSRAAKELGISRRTLVYRLDEFGLPRPRKSP